ncbi:MAG: chromosomal replication initiator protein DnaA [Anaerolineae bacterium]|nr:chromosomal replication initiator protein DnaA [Anaerolineae bacterium]
MDPLTLWNTALNQLEVQLDRASFETWLRGAVCLGIEESDEEPLFTIGVRNSYAVDMLQHRLYRTVRRILSDVYGSAVTIQFEVHHPTEKAPLADDQEKPLFRFLSQQTPPVTEEMSVPMPLHQQVARPERAELPECELNPRLTFDRFVVANNNNLTYSAALAVAENPSSIYNPFVVYGGVGLGKTHLLQAIAHACQQKGLRVIYIPSEAFINDLVGAIRQRTTAMFREKYRSVDVLLVDDIQFIAGKESTQEEFFHTFNALYTFNKQIVLASDRHPRELELLEDRLRSRFEGGLVMDVQLPEFEARVAILEGWAQERDIHVPRSVCEMIADRAHSNIRELEGLFTQVVAKARLGSQPLTLNTVETMVEAFERPRQHGRRAISIEEILEVTAVHHDLKIKDLTSKRRTGRINHARQVVMYLARELTECSLPQIGDALGGRSHTTVLHGYNKVAEMIMEDEVFRYELMGLREKLAARDR